MVRKLGKHNIEETLSEIVETPEKIVQTPGKACGNTTGNGKKCLGKEFCCLEKNC